MKNLVKESGRYRDDEGAVDIGLNGIFKEFCINAGKELIKRKECTYIDRINSDSTIWKISLGERKSDVLYNECIKENKLPLAATGV